MTSTGAFVRKRSRFREAAEQFLTSEGKKISKSSGGAISPDGYIDEFGADREYAVYVGADNVFDKKPPVLGQNAQSEITGTETAADTYDPFGRMWYAGVEVTF